MRPQTTFEHPQFSIQVDSVWRKYANVDNMAIVYDGDEAVENHPIIVPSGLFTLMRDTLKIAPKREVGVYFQVSATGQYLIFGLTDGIVEWDLWTYTNPSLPKFLTLTLDEL